MIDKRIPTLADRFIARQWPARERIIRPDVAVKIQARVRQARKFVFDEQAIEQVGRVVRTIPELLVREQAFARAPFDLMWIEFPHWRYWQVLCQDRPETDGYQDQSADHSLGYLIDHNCVSVIVGGTIASPLVPPQLMPMQYTLHTEWLIDDQIAFAERAGTSRMQLDRYLWGTTSLDIPDEDIRSLRAHHRLDMLPLNTFAGRTPDTRILRADGPMDTRTLLSGGAGELRTIIALLLMLNRPTITRYRNELPATRGWLKGKFIPYHKHTTVMIDLNAVETLKLIGTPAGEGVPRRAHEVEGHYCHDRAARDFLRIAGCQHDWRRTHEDWTPWPDGPRDDPGHWLCVACGGKRWWRHKHMRGDATVGIVTHDYEVTA